MTHFFYSEKDEELAFQYMLLTRQITKLSDSFQHMIRLGNKPKDEPNTLKYIGYTKFAQSELSDVYAQFVKICNLLDLDVEETQQMGMTRQKEKMEEYLKRYPGDVWL